jgi:hypothetical protein
MESRGILFVLAILASLFATTTSAQESIVIVKAEDLARCDARQLDALFASGYVSGVPVGRFWGMPLVNPGTPGAVQASLGGRFVWSGKRIDSESLTAVNRFFGLPMIRADARIEPSLRDGAPAIVLDYTSKSFLFRNVRDEIRELRPGLYLGYADDVRTLEPTARSWFVMESVP